MASARSTGAGQTQRGDLAAREDHLSETVWAAAEGDPHHVCLPARVVDANDVKPVVGGQLRAQPAGGLIAALERDNLGGRVVTIADRDSVCEQRQGHLDAPGVKGSHKANQSRDVDGIARADHKGARRRVARPIVNLGQGRRQGRRGIGGSRSARPLVAAKWPVGEAPDPICRPVEDHLGAELGSDAVREAKGLEAIARAKRPHHPNYRVTRVQVPDRLHSQTIVIVDAMAQPTLRSQSVTECDHARPPIVAIANADPLVDQGKGILDATVVIGRNQVHQYGHLAGLGAVDGEGRGQTQIDVCGHRRRRRRARTGQYQPGRRGRYAASHSAVPTTVGLCWFPGLTATAGRPRLRRFSTSRGTSLVPVQA